VNRYHLIWMIQLSARRSVPPSGGVVRDPGHLQRPVPLKTPQRRDGHVWPMPHHPEFPPILARRREAESADAVEPPRVRSG
jgi:hypothetical protein